MAQHDNKIYEVIVTTRSHCGLIHAAPMGIKEVNGHIQIQPFKPSATYDNLKSHRQCAINYTDDVRLFAGAVTDRRDWATLPCQHIDGGYLSEALVHSELEIVSLDDSEPRALFTGAVISEHIHKPFRGFNRAQSAVIEAAVLVSRLHMLSIEKIQREMTYLAIAINKTAGPIEQEAWGWLIDKIAEKGIELHND